MNSLDKECLQWNKIKDDPVRPELSLAWRNSVGTIFYTGTKDDPGAVCCVARCNIVPSDTRDLVLENGGDVLVAYTVWSYKPRAGRDLVFELRDYAINNKEINRLVTLSPKTKMARRFHLNNGAVLLSENQRTDNYEYELDGEK